MATKREGHKIDKETSIKLFNLALIHNRCLRISWFSFWLILSVIVLIVSIYFNWSHCGNLALVNDDIHREFVTPIRISQGEVIYKDFNFLYGPLPPYLNSWIITISPLKVFTTLRIVAFVLLLLDILFLWRISRQIALSWLFGPVLFGIVPWTDPYTFNPTTFNAIYTTFFATFGIWCAIKTLRGKYWPWIALGIACAGAFLSKPEGFFTVSLACIGAYLYLVHIKRNFHYTNILYWLAGFISFALSFVVYLLYKGLTWPELIEGLLQRRFQANLYAGYIEQYNYFFGINHVVVIAAGCVFIAIIFLLVKLYLAKRWPALLLVISLFAIAAFIFALSGQLIRVIDDYKTLGAFFGGISGYWWYKQLPEGNLKKGFFIFWLASLGEWLRPLFHIGALVIPFRVGGGMLLAVIFWFLILPSLFQKLWPGFVKNPEQVVDIFIKIGCVSVLVFGATGLYLNWDTQWRYPAEKFETPYGFFLANRSEESTKVAMEVIDWLDRNLKNDRRIVALEALPVELVTGSLPCIPLSQLNYQIYEGDTQKIISILEQREDIEYILVAVRHGGYHFGIQDYKLADYIDNQWKQAARFNVPAQLTSLSQMSAGRKYDSGLVIGFIIYARKQ